MTSRRRVRPGRGQSRASALYGTVVEQLRAHLSDRVRAAVGRHCSLVDSGAILRGTLYRLGLSAAADSEHFFLYRAIRTDWLQFSFNLFIRDTVSQWRFK